MRLQGMYFNAAVQVCSEDVWRGVVSSPTPKPNEGGPLNVMKGAGTKWRAAMPMVNRHSPLERRGALE